MGMDVSGLNPTCEDGEYFRANIWVWPMIHTVTITAAGDLIDAATKEAMRFNDGAGVRDADTCQKVAVRVEAWLGETQMDLGVRVPDGIEARLLKPTSGGFAVIRSGETIVEDAQIRDSVRQWVRFLKHCGGFRVD